MLVRPCPGRDPRSPCFNYMESYIAGTGGNKSLLNEGKGGRTRFMPCASVKPGLVLLKHRSKSKESGMLANGGVLNNNVISLIFSKTILCGI